MKSERISPFWVGGYPPFSAVIGELDFYTRYQSNLYGIETTVQGTPRPLPTGINRTFMELKPGNNNLFNAVASRINRTFMELKRHNRHRGRFCCKYQSNLYGIETKVGGWGRQGCRLYQSNLYGIETPLQVRNRWDCTPVSIEPLWNWNGRYNYEIPVASSINRTFMELKHRQNSVSIETMLLISLTLK